MTTDEPTKLRIEVAEKMGWTYYDDRQISYPYWRFEADRSKDTQNLPDFPTCHNAAFTLVTALAKGGWNCTIECHTDGTHHVSFWKDTVIKKDEEHSAHADTLPVAICLAALEVWKYQTK